MKMDDFDKTCVYSRNQSITEQLNSLAKRLNQNEDYIRTNKAWYRPAIDQQIDVTTLPNERVYFARSLPCLHIACLRAHVESVRFLVDECFASLAVRDSVGDTALHKVCKSSIDVCKKIEYLVFQDRFLLQARNGRCLLPLHLLAKQKNVDALKCMVQLCDKSLLNARSRHHLRPLHISARFGVTDNIRLLLNCDGIDVNAVDQHGDTAAHHAAYYGHLEALTVLREHKDYKSMKNNARNTPEDEIPRERKVLYSVEFLSLEHTKQAIERTNFNYATANDLGENVLHLACRSRVEPLAKVVLVTSAAPELCRRKNRAGQIPLHVAATRDNYDMFGLVCDRSLEVGTSVNCPDKEGATPLHKAIKGGSLRLIQCLLRQERIDVNCADVDGNTPAHIAANIQNSIALELLKAVPKFRADIRNKSLKTFSQCSPLNDILTHYAVSGSIFKMRRLLNQGADPDTTDHMENTCLHLACMSKVDSVEKVKLLLHINPTLINLQNTNRQCPLHCAIEKRNVAAIKQLLNHPRCSIDKEDDNMRTPLQCAALSNQSRVVKCFLYCSTCTTCTNDSDFSRPCSLPVAVQSSWFTENQLKNMLGVTNRLR